PEQRRLLGQELRVAGARTISVRRREHDQLRNLEVLRHPEELLEREQISGVPLGARNMRIVGDPEVDDGAEPLAAEALARRALQEIGSDVTDGLRQVNGRPAIESNHRPLTVQRTSDSMPETTTNASDEDRRAFHSNEESRARRQRAVQHVLDALFDE